MPAKKQPRKKASRRSRTKPDGPGFIARAGAAIGAAVRTLVSARHAVSGVVLTACVVGAAFGAVTLRDAAAERLSPGTGAATELVFTWPALDPAAPNTGTWLAPYFQERIVRTAAEAADARGPSPLDPRVLDDVTTALERSGWFVERPTARRDAEGRIAITAQWRVPIAVVRVSDVDHLVSTNAMPMPPRYGAGEPHGQRVITGAPRITPDYSSSSAYTHPWPGEGVPAAIELLRTLDAAGFADHVAGVDLSRFRTEGVLRIRSINDRIVVWGSPPRVFRPGEATDAEKLDRLAQLVERFGSIDAGRDNIALQGPRLEIDRRPSP